MTKPQPTLGQLATSDNLAPVLAFVAAGAADVFPAELRAFAAKASLPTDDVELMQLAAHYLEDDALIDQDLDVQTYVQLMLAAKQSAAHGVPLWIAVE